MICSGLFSKFGALFVTLPDPIIGGLFMVLFGKYLFTLINRPLKVMMTNFIQPFGFDP